MGDRLGESRSLNNLGLTLDHEGRYSEAGLYYEQALHIRREVGDRRGEGNILSNLGQLYWKQGAYDEAMSYYEQTLQLRQDIDDQWGIAVVPG